ncbi:DUF1289 domain-containing protein [Sphingobium baderi]|uniref:DUF1289 domain-containing protein n=1 Tax=Sphingobium baderi TaxID=1332080 RepID=UPI001F1C0610|nr:MULTISPECIES: DUF1289 domain-containing protein [Sphingobium]WRD78317.1 DUF1289 domain-containing protein [Sphingobium baderi]
MIESPCIKVCLLDETGRTCTGCGRTLEEIARWSRMTDRERSVIMARLKSPSLSPPRRTAP